MKISAKSKKITVKILNDTDDMVLIEGNQKGLQMLGNLILERAKDDYCGFQISPKGAGQRNFYKNSTHGLYIHRIPCEHSRKKRR